VPPTVRPTVTATSTACKNNGQKCRIAR
jgi:hypothetical protein